MILMVQNASLRTIYEGEKVLGLYKHDKAHNLTNDVANVLLCILVFAQTSYTSRSVWWKNQTDTHPKRDFINYSDLIENVNTLYESY